MKKILTLLLISLLLFSVACAKKTDDPLTTESTPEVSTAEAEKNDLYVAMVDAEGITKERFDNNLKMVKYDYIMRYGADYFTRTEVDTLTPLKENLLEDLINEVFVIRLANELGLEVTPQEVEDQFKLYMDTMVGTEQSPSEGGAELKAYFEENAITDEFIKSSIERQLIFRAYLNHLQESIQGDEALLTKLKSEVPAQVRASHILVKTKEQADEIYAILKDDPTQFEKMVEEHTIDTGSKATQGDLDYFMHAEMVPEFADAAFAAEEGTITEPVQSQFGYHIIKVVDKRSYQDMKTAGSSEAELAEIENNMISQEFRTRYFAAIDALKAKAKIIRYALD